MAGVLPEITREERELIKICPNNRSVQRLSRSSVDSTRANTHGPFTRNAQLGRERGREREGGREVDIESLEEERKLEGEKKTERMRGRQEERERWGRRKTN